MTWEPSLENYGNLLLHGHMKLAVGGMGISKTSGNIIEGATTAVFLINSSSSSSSSSEVAKEREFFLLDRILVIVRTTRSVFRKEYGSRGAIIHKLVDRVAIVAGLVVTEIFDGKKIINNNRIEFSVYESY